MIPHDVGNIWTKFHFSGNFFSGFDGFWANSTCALHSFNYIFQVETKTQN